MFVAICAAAKFVTVCPVSNFFVTTISCFKVWSVTMCPVSKFGLSRYVLFQSLVCHSMSCFKLWSVTVHPVSTFGLSQYVLFQTLICHGTPCFNVWSVTVCPFSKFGLSRYVLFQSLVCFGMSCFKVWSVMVCPVTRFGLLQHVLLQSPACGHGIWILKMLLGTHSVLVAIEAYTSFVLLTVDWTVLLLGRWWAPTNLVYGCPQTNWNKSCIGSYQTDCWAVSLHQIVDLCLFPCVSCIYFCVFTQVCILGHQVYLRVGYKWQLCPFPCSLLSFLLLLQSTIAIFRIGFLDSFFFFFFFLLSCLPYWLTTQTIITKH